MHLTPYVSPAYLPGRPVHGAQHGVHGHRDGGDPVSDENTVRRGASGVCRCEGLQARADLCPSAEREETVSPVINCKRSTDRWLVRVGCLAAAWFVYRTSVPGSSFLARRGSAFRSLRSLSCASEVANTCKLRRIILSNTHPMSYSCNERRLCTACIRDGGEHSVLHKWCG